MFGDQRSEQLQSSVVHQPIVSVLPAEEAEEVAPPTTSSIPIIDTLMSIPYKPPPRRPHRIVPAGPPVLAGAHHANLNFERMTYSYDWTEKLGMVVGTFAAALGVTASIFGWMFLNG